MERSIDVSTTIRATAEDAGDVLLDDPGAVFSEATTASERRERRFQVELAVDLGGGATVTQEVVVRLGTARRGGLGLAVPLAWQATGRGRLFPSFVGQLELSEDAPGSLLQLTGRYKVPLGVVGRFGDGVAGRRLARQSLAALVEQMARRLDGEVARRLASVSWRPSSYPIALNEHG